MIKKRQMKSEKEGRIKDNKKEIGKDREGEGRVQQ